MTRKADKGAGSTQAQASKIAELANEITDRATHIVESDRIALKGEAGLILSASESTHTSVAENDYLVAKAESHYKVRRRRESIVGKKDMFSDPCWDILLDLFIAHGKNRQISITSACLAAQVPASTALRWITVLEKMGLIERQRDTKDARRRFVQLTPKAIAQVSDILASAD